MTLKYLEIQITDYDILQANNAKEGNNCKSLGTTFDRML